ncbi:hypothetical protein MJM99_29770, partial [Salmonella enterica subsp. enterica serovar Kentucky]|nr:hypothetical protein [Salmonella enterica subsp. enterica serovar Kentucky]
NHFDTSVELEAMLEKRVKRQLLEEVQSICPPHVTIMQVRQGLYSISNDDQASDIITNQRQIQTTVQIKDGQTLLLGGLIDSSFS